MGENYCECLTAQKVNGKYRMFTFLAIALGVVFAFAGFFIILPAMVPAILCAGLAWYFSRFVYVEYEYLLLDHEITVDGIYGKFRRKTLKNCSCRKIESFQPAGEGQLDHLKRQNIKIEDYSSGAPGENYLMVVGGEGGRTACLLTPNEEMLEQLSRELPRAVFTR